MSLAEMLAEGADTVQFRAAYADTYPNVRIGGGKSVPAAWLDGVYAYPGTSVLVAQMTYKDAPVSNLVVGTFTGAQPREATVTVVPGGSSTISVAAGGITYVVTFLSSYTPVVNDVVRLFWQGMDGTALGKVGATPALGTPVFSTPPPPAALTSGYYDFIAYDSATYSPSLGWNNWSGGGSIVDTGTWAGYVLTGAWFYNGLTSQLAGKTTNRLQLYIPARSTTAGDYSSALDLNVYLHTSNTRPGGDVSRGASTVINIPSGWGGGYKVIPAGWGATLASGGGISIAGGSYMSFQGIAQNPASGQLHADWSS